MTHTKNKYLFTAFSCKLSSFNDCLPYLLLFLVALVVNIGLLIKHPYSATFGTNTETGGSVHKQNIQKQRQMLEAIQVQPS